MTPRRKRYPFLEFVVGFFSVFCAILVAHYISFHIFWWCPIAGDCNPDRVGTVIRILGYGMGFIALMLLFAIIFIFPIVLLVRPFCSKRAIQTVCLSSYTPFLGWHTILLSKWIDFLWDKKGEAA